MSDSENLPRQRIHPTRPSNRVRSHDVYSESKLPTRHRNRISQSSMINGLLAILHSTLTIMRMVLHLLKIPAVIALAILVVLYFWQYVLIPTICQVPGGAYVVPMCKNTVAIEDPYFDTVIRQDRELVKMQQMASDNTALPLLLLVGESDIKDLVFALSAVDTPSKTKLMPILQHYGDLVLEVADGIQDCLASTDQLVDNVILTNTWTEYRLQAISDRETSITAPVTRLLDRIMDVSTRSERVRPEAQLRSAFHYYTDKLQEQAGKTLLEYQKVRLKMTGLRILLDAMAAAFAEEGSILKLDKLGRTSYWKWILRSHRHKIADFDQKMLLCAKFYNHSREGEKIVTVTILKLQEMRGRISRLKDELSTASSQPTQGAEVSTALQLSIDRLRASVKYLESSKHKSREQRKQRMIDFENDYEKRFAKTVR